MAKKKFECASCDAFGYITILNDSTEFYEIVACPACGSELDSSMDDEEEE